MYCDICKEFFQPEPDLERLMTTGATPCTCNQCATNAWAESVKNKVLPPPVYPGTEFKGDGRQLYRVIWLRTDGTAIATIALPPRPLRAPLSPLRPKKVGTLHVTVMSMEDRGGITRMPGEPLMRLETNLECFREWHPPILWIQKHPDCADAVTGIGRIEIPARDVLEVVREDDHVDVKTRAGETLRLFYR